MKPRARGYRVVVELDAVEEKTAGGIIITHRIKQTDEICCTTGTIVEIGEFSYKEYPGYWFKVGERVIFAEHSGRLWKDTATGKLYRIMNDLDILAVAEGE